MDKDDLSVGTGLVGAPACGDVMKLQVGLYAYNTAVLGKITLRQGIYMCLNNTVIFLF